MKAATAELHRLLKLNHWTNDLKLAPPGIPTNHVTNDLVAMWKSGASAERLREWYESYNVMGSGYGSMRPITGERGSITLDNWGDKRGTSNWAGWVQFFDDEIVRLGGTDKMLQRYLSESEFGGNVCQSLLHGLIAVGYGIDVASGEMISEGMAMIAQRWVDLPPLTEVGEERKLELSTFSELIQSFSLLARDPRAPEERKAIGPLVNDAASFPLVWEIEKLFKPGPCSTPFEIQSACRLLSSVSFYILYEGGPKDFALLHLVTSAPALTSLCLLLPHLAISLMRRWWATTLTAYLWRGCPRRPSKLSNNESSSHSWKELCQLAFQHNDEHVVKGVLACAEAEAGGWVDVEIRSHLKCLAEIMLKLPSPPAPKMGENDWWYPSEENPWATLPDIRSQ
eukprot:TRINITY_DN5725_c0_g1_i1.p1 TRINITY_DN5725_c0_g1~~TRINITY_DN5725_c0_g1_i1.p1  ORF type:complete len:397 (-),score=48.21 TRINITY_DN5725_c0_g1_i1:52-1242(-)